MQLVINRGCGLSRLAVSVRTPTMHARSPITCCSILILFCRLSGFVGVRFLTPIYLNLRRKTVLLPPRNSEFGLTKSGLGSVQDRGRQGSRPQAYKDVFTACLETLTPDLIKPQQPSDPMYWLRFLLNPIVTLRHWCSMVYSVNCGDVRALFTRTMRTNIIVKHFLYSIIINGYHLGWFNCQYRSCG